MKTSLILISIILTITACSTPGQIFIDAAKKGDVPQMEKQLELKDVMVMTRDKTGATALHWAALEGKTNAVQWLLDQGAEVDVRETGTGYTPLHMAAWKGRVSVIPLLLAAGADINARDQVYGNTPLFWANAYGQYPAIVLLVTNGADYGVTNDLGYNVLHVAAREKYTPLVQYYLELGMHIDTAHRGNGLTPIMVAAFMGHVDVMRLLLTNGADPLKTNTQGQSAVSMGLSNKRSFMKKFVKDMISNGMIVLPEG